MTESSLPGSVAGVDLTVPDAAALRDFYAAVVGWEHDGWQTKDEHGAYEDYFMRPPGAASVAGICHQRGENADLPPVWLVYLVVADLDASLAACIERGGTALTHVKGELGQARYCVIRDPAGAMVSLMEHGSS